MANCATWQHLIGRQFQSAQLVPLGTELISFSTAQGHQAAGTRTAFIVIYPLIGPTAFYQPGGGMTLCDLLRVRGKVSQPSPQGKLKLPTNPTVQRGGARATVKDDIDDAHLYPRYTDQVV